MCPPSESAQRAYGEYDDLELELLGTLKDIDDVHVTSSRDLVTAYVTRNVHDHARDRLTARAQTPGAWNESRGWVQRALGVDPGALQPHRLRERRGNAAFYISRLPTDGSSRSRHRFRCRG